MHRTLQKKLSLPFQKPRYKWFNHRQKVIPEFLHYVADVTVTIGIKHFIHVADTYSGVFIRASRDETRVSLPKRLKKKITIYTNTDVRTI